jgi:hypothetical protein
MTKTLVAVFANLPDARDAVRQLHDAGFPENAIGMVAHREHCGASLGVINSVSDATNLGALAAIGGVTGFAAGLVALAIPGIGPIVAAGPIAVELLGGGGTVAGLLFGRLKEQGASTDDVHCYCEALRRGSIVVTIETPEDRAPAAERIIGAARLVDIEECATEWHRQGWKGFEPHPQASSPTSSSAAAALPFDPDSLRPSIRRQRQERNAFRAYFRVS